ncbi:LysR family transcriptional regulator [Devosia ginsengisoli]|uniref:LysR family transcriptional regulator n=1 Tax=Devosia ginsengisoli TaxID=400770 RepID=UPI0026EA8F97|nr:LysR family transcriptional regulator [Devosia ginsengisoli]MCR6673042.1 LysR family transcriptional regulator [Devosia ginsengisoli]
MKPNLRHLRVFLAAFDSGSISQAAGLCSVSQPAATQSIRKLEEHFTSKLFHRTPQGLLLTDAGGLLANRVRRAFALLDPALGDLSPRLHLTATSSQLTALVAGVEMENFTLAARKLGLAQPSVHRAISDLEKDAGRPLFERTSRGMHATRPATRLAQAVQLAFAEIYQAEADLGELSGREVGRIVVGAMPLSRSSILPEAIARFRRRRATLPIQALDGPYDDLIAGLRRGEVDFLVGAMRDPPPIGDVVQDPLFDDELIVVCRPGHPLLAEFNLQPAQLSGFPWVVNIPGTPARNMFEKVLSGPERPTSLVETGSMVLMRELLQVTDHLGFISSLQIRSDLLQGVVVRLPAHLADTTRPIGLTFRAGWIPTSAQRDLIADIRAATAAISGRE